MNKWFAQNRIKLGNAVILAALAIITIACWNEYSWYEKVAPYGTVISFVALAIAAICYVDIKDMIKDRQAWLLAAGCAVALVNIIIVKSGFGAFFTAADLLLMLYLADKLRFDKRTIIGFSAYSAFYFFYWTIDVKGYFKGYNTNYGGLILIVGFIYAIILLTILYDYSAKSSRNKLGILVLVLMLLMFVLGYKIIAWYRARCAFLGLLTFALIMLIPRKISARKWLYNLMTFGAGAGAIIVSVLYVLLGKVKDYINIRIFYKDLISGREQIWSELWSAYLKKPITGIGSSYVIKVEWMEGMFEVHNGLLDILIVHGAVVFAIAIVLLSVKIMNMRSKVEKSPVAKASFAGIISILVSSFLENFFIVPPFLILFMLLFAVGDYECKAEEA